MRRVARRMTTLCAAGLVAALSAMGEPRLAGAKPERQQEHGGAKEERKEAQGAAKEERKEAQEAAKEERKEAQEAAKEERKEAQEAVKADHEPETAAGKARAEAARRRMAQRPGLSQAQEKARQEHVQKVLASQKGTRDARRKAHREQVQAKWGPAATTPAVRAELRHHAWRVARLEGIKSLANAEGRADVAARADQLLAKENARHEKHMAVLTSNLRPQAGE